MFCGAFTWYCITDAARVGSIWILHGFEFWGLLHEVPSRSFPSFLLVGGSLEEPVDKLCCHVEGLMLCCIWRILLDVCMEKAGNRVKTRHWVPCLPVVKG